MILFRRMTYVRCRIYNIDNFKFWAIGYRWAGQRHRSWRERRPGVMASWLLAGMCRGRKGRGASPCGECHLQPGERCDICGARGKP